MSKSMAEYLRSRGIVHRVTAPLNLHQNGVAERTNRTLLELTHSMLHYKTLPQEFWGETIVVVAHVKNIVTTRVLRLPTTPFQIIFGTKPTLSYVRTFGSRCWYNIKRETSKKLGPRAQEGIIIRYARGLRGYKLWDVENKTSMVSRHIQFDVCDDPKKLENDSPDVQIIDQVPAIRSLDNHNGESNSASKTGEIEDQNENEDETEKIEGTEKDKVDLRSSKTSSV